MRIRTSSESICSCVRAADLITPSKRALFHPCASLSLHVHHVVKRTCTSQLSTLLGMGTLSASFHQGYASTQPPEPPLNALLHKDCTGKAPVDKVMSAAAPCPEEIQAHLSPFSAPPESSQPPFGNWSVIVSAIS